MKVFNSLSRTKEEFVPLKEGAVGMYVCGPTVYDVGHLGHARSAVSFDIIRRYFLYKGYTVTFVSNLTDVDDKIIKRAAQLGLTESELVEKIIPEYAEDYARLAILPPDHQPRATDPRYMKDMVQLVEVLLEKDAAYETDDGVYFLVDSFPSYGKLSHQNMDELKAGARVVVDEKKRNPEDFALWKKEKPGEPSWEGPRGMRGRPGWHIECSAMSAHILGTTFDIHGGGIDLIFPHHEGELAQSEKANDKPFARYWLHNGHVQVQKEKMSKSLGNFFTIKEILAQYHPQVVRFFLISTQYRMPIDFSHDLLDQARNSLSRLQDCYRALQRKAAEVRPAGSHDTKWNTLVKTARKSFEQAMDDDFEISRSLAAIFTFVGEVNTELTSLTPQDASFILKEFFYPVDSVLAVIRPEEQVLDTEVDALIAERNMARKNKDFTKADELRKKLDAMGIVLEDTPQGTVWKKAL